jgi:hypothetical protein
MTIYLGARNSIFAIMLEKINKISTLTLWQKEKQKTKS